MIISIFIYILWIFVYTVGIQLIVIVGHRKMYELKMKNGWLIEEQKKYILIQGFQLLMERPLLV